MYLVLNLTGGDSLLCNEMNQTFYLFISQIVCLCLMHSRGLYQSCFGTISIAFPIFLCLCKQDLAYS